jgi:hypothetical protein
MRQTPAPAHAFIKSMRLGLDPPLLEAGQAPTDHRRLDGAAGLIISPSTINPPASERQLIGAAVIFAKHLNRLIRRRFAVAVELGQTSFARCHFRYSPKKK